MYRYFYREWKRSEDTEHGLLEMYKIKKKLGLKTPKNVIKSVVFNNIEYNINSEIAENYKDYFANSIKEIRRSIEDAQYRNNRKYRNNNNYRKKVLTYSTQPLILTIKLYRSPQQ